MTPLWLLLTLLSWLLLGSPVAVALRRRTPAEFLLAALLCGPLVLTGLMWLALLLGEWRLGAAGCWSVTLLAGATAWLLSLVLSQRGASSGQSYPPTEPLGWPSVGLLGLAWLTAVGQALLRPLWGWDSWAQWGYKALAFAHAGGFPVAFLTTPKWSHFAHPSYPPLVPATGAWMMLLSGQHTERLYHLTSPVWLLSWLVLLVVACGGSRRGPWAWCAVLLGAWTPILLDHGQAGYANLPCGLYLVAGMVLLERGIERRDAGSAVLAGLSFSGAALSRIEGTHLALLWLAVTLLVSLFTGRGGWRRTLAATAWAVACVVATSRAWAVQVAAWELPSEARLYLGEEPTLNLLRKALMFPEDAVFALWKLFEVTVSNPLDTATGPLGGSWGVLWLVVVLAPAMQPRWLRRGPVASRLLATVLTLGFYALLWIAPPREERYRSFDRYLMPLGMLLVVTLPEYDRAEPPEG